MTDLENLHGFVREMMENWPYGEADAELHDLALKHGLIKLKDPPPDKPCKDDFSRCDCSVVYDPEDFAAGIVECFERTELLRGL